jgi:hypothetical protein
MPYLKPWPSYEATAVSPDLCRARSGAASIEGASSSRQERFGVAGI